MVKYAERKDKSRIKECFQSIPRQLSKENKKFQYSVVKKGSTAAKYAGIISRCYNLSITELPLDGNAEEDCFKVYMRDCGLFVSMLEDGTQYGILQGNLYGYKGAMLVEVKANTGNTKSTKPSCSILKNIMYSRPLNWEITIQENGDPHWAVLCH